MEKWKEEQLDKAITNNEGVKAISLILNNDYCELIVSPENFNDLLTSQINQRNTLESLDNEDLIQNEDLSQSHYSQRPDLDSNYKEPVDETEKVIANIWQDVLGINQVGKGKLVLGTVYGDVHDIGKNLVKTIFENNGYTVYDLGKQVPLQKFLEKIDEVKPDAIGLSALLVSTSKQMQFFVEHARKTNMKIPVLCGGAAINTNYINRIAKEGGIYESGMFYCNTMFEGLKTMDKLVSDEKDDLIKTWKEKLETWKDRTTVSTGTVNIPRSEIKPVIPPTPPSLNSPIRLKSNQINIDEVWGLLDKKSLFKLSWGLRGKAGQESEEEHEKLLEQWIKRISEDNLFEPQVVYGYFKCHNKDGKLVVDSSNNENYTFDFPRSTKSKHLCLSDYFGENDVVAFQSVTVGNKVPEIIERWNKEDKYTDAYYLHGLAVEFAESMAEWVNRKIKSELNIGEKRGLRYSWGYPSCPDILQHKLVWKLLEPEKSDMTLTESGQIIPDQSTAAMVVHHPEAEYFVL
jgi:5-methyltetrahydrofolate--homocysteine methyltransferase